MPVSFLANQVNCLHSSSLFRQHDTYRIAFIAIARLYLVAFRRETAQAHIAVENELTIRERVGVRVLRRHSLYDDCVEALFLVFLAYFEQRCNLLPGSAPGIGDAHDFFPSIAHRIAHHVVVECSLFECLQLLHGTWWKRCRRFWWRWRRGCHWKLHLPRAHGLLLWHT